MGPRAGPSTVLVLGAIVLIVAILVGNRMGSRVIGQIARRADAQATPLPVPSPSPIDATAAKALWKRRQVLSVATDPAFPDPRVTPEPEVPRTPRPRRPTPRPSPGPTQNPTDVARTPDPTYTSPPLAIPLVTHQPGETSPPDDAGSPSPRPSPTASGRAAAARTYPSLPPVTMPSLSP